MAVSGFFYLATVLLWWWIGTLAFGIAVGLLTPGRGRLAGYLPWIVLIAVSLGLSLTRTFEGRAGFWFDSALLLVATYFAGCLIGALGRDLLGVGERVVSTEVPVLAGSVAPAAPAPLETIAPYQWQALRDGETLTLTGYVPSTVAKTRIMAAAKALLPKLTVTDRLQMGAGAPEGLETLAGSAFGQLARLESGTVSLVDHAYALTGVAKSDQAKAAVLKMTASLPAGYQLSNADITLMGEASQATEPVPDVAATLVPEAPSDPLAGIAAQVEGTAAPSAEPPKPDDKPAGLQAPREGKADDLKRIKGIGRQNQTKLNDLGIWHFDQIAAWNAREVAWVGAFLAFPGRIERERWVDQAKQLAAGAETEFSRRVDRGEVATSAGGATAAPPIAGSAPAVSPDTEPSAPSPEPVVSPATPIGSADAFRPSNALDEPRNGKPDKLVYVNGIDEALQTELNRLGVFHFQQLAQLTKGELAELSVALGHPGKASEDNWKGEAAMLAIGSDTAHSKAVKAKAGSLGDIVPKKA